ncbi:hypothetical protein CAMSH0001_1002 [Campylobacter showae RM3277]|uniref:Uncharacterized protein n=1 Tax=Campylobacter showae RM3277 TaxID=553219 RepID=C6RER9_9BACT|nr:hypothetical protein CAMSH0001_1002 [Campylobacter showae RM3277]
MDSIENSVVSSRFIRIGGQICLIKRLTSLPKRQTTTAD